MLIIETLRLQHQPDKAMAEADAAVKTYPKDQDLAIQHATMLGEGGHVDEAVAQLRDFPHQSPHRSSPSIFPLPRFICRPSASTTPNRRFKKPWI